MYEKAAIFTVRYSLYSERSRNDWKIGRESGGEYLPRLFSSERLKFRRWTFANVTLPSVAAAIAREPAVYSEVHVLTSTLLPQEDKTFLERMSAEYPFLKVFHQPPEAASTSAETARFCEALPRETVVASIRIDDDDAISRDYLVQMGEYIRPDMVGHAISLCSGYVALGVPDGRVVGPFSYTWRTGSVGLALIRRGGRADAYDSVFAAGNHMHIEEKVPTILDGRTPAMMRLIHDGNDSKKKEKMSFEAEAFSPEARDAFGLEPRIWMDPPASPTDPHGHDAPAGKKGETTVLRALETEVRELRKERDSLKVDLNARRSRIAWCIDYTDYLLHAGLARAPILPMAIRRRFKSGAEGRRHSTYHAPSKRTGPSGGATPPPR